MNLAWTHDIKVDRNESTPMHLQLEDQIRRKISRGDLASGSRLPGARELSKAFGVAYPTMFRTLKDLKDQGFLERIPHRGTFVRALEKRVKNIAIVFDSLRMSLRDANLDPCLRGFSKELDPQEYHLQLFALPDAVIFPPAQETFLSQSLRNGSVNGIFVLSPPPPDDMEQLEAMKIPAISLGDQYLSTQVPYVMHDVADGASQVVNFLVNDLGHQHIKLIMGFEHGHTDRLLRQNNVYTENLLAELHNHKIPDLDKAVAYSEFMWEKTAPVLREWLTAPNRPTALIFGDDCLAENAVRLARELGLNVPHDLSIVGVGDYLPASQLTTLHVSQEELCAKAAEHIQQILEGQPVSKNIVSPVTLKVRQTCGPTPKMASRN